MLIGLSLDAQSKNEFTKTSFSKELSFIRIDSINSSQSTVVEYPKFLVVIELPMKNSGGGKATDLEEDIPTAERYLQFLRVLVVHGQRLRQLLRHERCVACR